MTEFLLLIDGDLCEGDGHHRVINPATEEEAGRCAVAAAPQLERAVAAANRAFDSWRRTSQTERREVLHAVAKCLEDNQQILAELITAEQGKPLRDALGEVKFARIYVEHFANQEIPVEVRKETDKVLVEIHRVPLGVVACICPWNFPLFIAVYKLAPALLAGNTVIIKPAPTTPLATLKLGELIKDIVPPGVVNILADRNDLGPFITSHPEIAKISFTGSNATGRKIMANSADTLKRMVLELSGNDAAIVLGDVDVDKVAPKIFGAAFANSGQVCAAIKRLYVAESIYDAMCDALARLAADAVVGDGRDEKTQFGPVQNATQFERVRAYLEDAKANGRVIAGGEIGDGPGYFVPLTVVRDIAEGTRVVDEEPFGPILPVIKFNDIDEAIERANRSTYGLGGSVWSSDVEKAHDVAERLDAGTVWVNQHCAMGPDIPFSPAKQSGIGVEWGREGLLEFTSMKVINLRK